MITLSDSALVDLLCRNGHDERWTNGLGFRYVGLMKFDLNGKTAPRPEPRPSRHRGPGLLGYGSGAVVLGMVLTLLSLHPAGAGARKMGQVSGGTLYDHCIQPPNSEKQVLMETFCIGYVHGVVEGGAYDACLPHNFKFSQLKDIVIVWLRDHPTQRRHNAAASIRDALESAYPCR